jgi:hypothetical protein
MTCPPKTGPVEMRVLLGYKGGDGIVGTFHHVSKQHLDRYLSEFDFRYNSRETTDVERAELAIAGVVGKRLTYK